MLKAPSSAHEAASDDEETCNDDKEFEGEPTYPSAESDGDDEASPDDDEVTSVLPTPIGEVHWRFLALGSNNSIRNFACTWNNPRKLSVPISPKEEEKENIRGLASFPRVSRFRMCNALNTLYNRHKCRWTSGKTLHCRSHLVRVTSILEQHIL